MVETELQHKVEDEVLECIVKAEQHYNETIPNIPIKYKNIGRTAGRFSRRSAGIRKYITFNPILLNENGKDFIERTVPHEVAHYLVTIFHPMSRPHGKEWKFVMNIVLKAKDSTRCHKYNVSNCNKKTTRKDTYFKHIYLCNCQEHFVSTRKHNNIQRMQKRHINGYTCKKCNGSITYLHTVKT